MLCFTTMNNDQLYQREYYFDKQMLVNQREGHIGKKNSFFVFFFVVFVFVFFGKFNKVFIITAFEKFCWRINASFFGKRRRQS